MTKAGIFDNDLAREVRRDFQRLMDEGSSSYVAADRILAANFQRIHDPDSAPSIYFALAELQLDCGALTPAIRKRALTLINSGEALERWRGAAPELIEARRRVEQDLRHRLVATG